MLYVIYTVMYQKFPQV